MKKDNSQAGFNLIEGAIVLSIISALIGVVAIGRELISSGKVVAVISELSYFSQAKEQYMQQYKYRPGDMPQDLTQTMFSAPNTTINCDDGTPGDGRWDVMPKDFEDQKTQSVYEVDYAFNQLSALGLIKQSLHFDPCDGRKNRKPGVDRPASDADDTIGYTFVNEIFLKDGDGNWRNFLYALKVGKYNTENGSDMHLDGGAFNATIHREIDAKIDQPDTPWSGKYIVSSECFDKNGYLNEDSEDVCTGSLVEIDPNPTPKK